VEGAPALERLIFLLLRHAPDSGITQVETAIVAARAEAANREQQMKLSNLDWAEAHTYAQKKAKELGVPESKVDGDSYGVPAIEDLIDMIAEQAANRRPATGEDERVAVLLSRLDAVCCILAIVDGSMPTKQELGMAYDELVSVRDDVAGIIRHLPAPSHSDVEQLLDDCLLYLQSAEKNIQDHSPFAGTPWHDRLKKLIGQLYERKYKMTTATKGSE